MIKFPGGHAFAARLNALHGKRGSISGFGLDACRNSGQAENASGLEHRPDVMGRVTGVVSGVKEAWNVFWPW